MSMFEDLFTYNPNAISAEYRQQMANILKARGEFLRLSAEVSDLRGRAWVGEQGLENLIEIKAMNLAKLRQDYSESVLAFLKDVVDIDSLKELLPMLGLAILQNFKVPLPVIMESVGADMDTVKKLAADLKKLIED